MVNYTFISSQIAETTSYIHCHSTDQEGTPFRQDLVLPIGRSIPIGSVCTERQIFTPANGTSCSRATYVRTPSSLLFCRAAECMIPTNASHFDLLCLCNARSFLLLPAAVPPALLFHLVCLGLSSILVQTIKNIYIFDV